MDEIHQWCEHVEEGKGCEKRACVRLYPLTRSLTHLHCNKPEVFLKQAHAGVLGDRTLLNGRSEFGAIEEAVVVHVCATSDHELVIHDHQFRVHVDGLECAFFVMLANQTIHTHAIRSQPTRRRERVSVRVSVRVRVSERAGEREQECEGEMHGRA
jgi:hypothetical protein